MSAKNPGKTRKPKHKDFLHYLDDQPDMLRANPLFFSDLLNVVPAAIYHSSYDPRSGQWLIRYVSQGVERLLGYKAAELENKRNFKDLVLTNTRHYEFFERTATPDNARFRFTFEFRTAKGQGKWCSDDGIILFDESGQVRGSVGIFVDITDHKQRERELEEVNLRLKTAIKTPARFGGMVGKSLAMRKVFSKILKMALSTTNMVILGESGTGKELAARAIHDLSNRNTQNFIAVNCSSISESLFESEFFGHKKGSFTGAVEDRQGYLDNANGGTLFLDEVGEIPLTIQTKLLRVLDGYGYMPVGGNKVRHSDFRLIAATNRNLEILVSKGLMREDFYYRLNAIPFYIPPLRKRVEDIPLLINYFLSKHKMTFEDLPPEFFQRLLSYSWPGNIRELQNVLSRYIAFQETELRQSKSKELRQVLPDFTFSDNFFVPPAAPEAATALRVPDVAQSFEYFERARLLMALNGNEWNVNIAAGQLNISRSTLYRKMKKYGLMKR